MPRETKEERWRRVHEKAVRQLDTIQEAVYDLRQECLQDRRFYSINGAQFEDPTLSTMFEYKPKIEINKTHRAVMRIIAEQRNNQVDVVFVPSDGQDDNGLAETLNGLYRADKQDSHGDEAFRNAFEEAVGGGFGAFRLYTKYEDESDPENERQRICFDVITDADENVFFDLNSKRQDKSDAQYCFVLSGMTPEAFEEQWGDMTLAGGEYAVDKAQMTSVNHPIEQTFFDWSTPDLVYIAEYYVIEEVRKRFEVWSDVLGNEEQYEAEELREREEDDGEEPTLLETLIATRSRFVRSRTVKVKQVHKYIISGAVVLEDCGVIAGPNIPIIPVYGMRWFIDGEERYMGRVRMAKDPQRLLNMQVSRMAELAAISPNSKPILAAEQVDQFHAEWEDDNIVNHPYLRLSLLKDKEGNPIAPGPIGMIEAPQVPPATAALVQYTELALQDILGGRNDAQKMRSNISADAIELVQNDLDMDSYIFIDNGAIAQQRGGAVWLGMAKELYIEEGRVMKTVGTQGQVGSVKLMRPNSGDSGAYKENDLTSKSMDVTVEIGPASRTRKDSIVRTMSQLLPAAQTTGNPTDVRNILGMIVMNLEGDGISDLQEYYRKEMVKIGSMKPTEEEAKAMAEAAANQQPDAQTQWAMAAASKEQALAEKAKADTMKALAEIEATRAKTGLTWAQAVEVAEGIDMAQKDILLRMIQMLDSGQTVGV